MSRAKIAQIVAVVVALVGAFVAFRTLPVGEHLTAFLEWVRGAGIWGPVVLGVAYVIATVAFFPGSILTLGAGFAFGVLIGTITVSAASVVGATLAFLIGRTVARGPIEQKVRGRPKFDAVDRAVGREGLKIVLLTRLSPVFPFNLLNYFFGITDVRLGHYVLGSWVGMLPGTVMYVYLGATAQNVAKIAAGEVSGGGTGQRVLFGVGLLATIAVTVYVTRLARRALADAVPEAVDEGAEDASDAA